MSDESWIGLHWERLILLVIASLLDQRRELHLAPRNTDGADERGCEPVLSPDSMSSSSGALDLIPNLVATVKGYVKEESTVLTEYRRMRALAIMAAG